MNKNEMIKTEKNAYKKVSRTKKLVYISLGLIVVGMALFSLSLLGLNHTAIDKPIYEVFKLIGTY